MWYRMEYLCQPLISVLWEMFQYLNRLRIFYKKAMPRYTMENTFHSFCDVFGVCLWEQYGLAAQYSCPMTIDVNPQNNFASKMEAQEARTNRIRHLQRQLDNYLAYGSVGVDISGNQCQQDEEIEIDLDAPEVKDEEIKRLELMIAKVVLERANKIEAEQRERQEEQEHAGKTWIRDDSSPARLMRRS